MKSRGKMAAVAVLLLVAAAAVVLFRKQPSTTSPDGASDSTVVLREDAPQEGDAPVAAPRFVGKIEPLESTDVASAGSGIGVATLPAAPVPAPNSRASMSNDGGLASAPYGSSRPSAAARSAAPARSPTPNPASDGPLHRIVDGDTLSDLARRYLGDSGRYLEIYDLNRGVLPDADLLPIGVEIRIPRPDARPPASPGVTAGQLVPVAPRPDAS